MKTREELDKTSKGEGYYAALFAAGAVAISIVTVVEVVRLGFNPSFILGIGLSAVLAYAAVETFRKAIREILFALHNVPDEDGEKCPDGEMMGDKKCGCDGGAGKCSRSQEVTTPEVEN